jgi:hypothetical protein
MHLFVGETCLEGWSLLGVDSPFIQGRTTVAHGFLFHNFHVICLNLSFYDITDALHTHNISMFSSATITSNTEKTVKFS